MWSAWPFAACSAAALAAAFCRRFCFLRFTVGAVSLLALGSGGGALCLVVVGVEGWDDSEGVPLGTVMNLEPSLLVYLARFRGDAGVCVAGFWLVAGIVGYGARAVESMKRPRATRVCRSEGGEEREGASRSSCHGSARCRQRCAAQGEASRVQGRRRTGARCELPMMVEGLGRLKMRHSLSPQVRVRSAMTPAGRWARPGSIRCSGGERVRGSGPVEMLREGY